MTVRVQLNRRGVGALLKRDETRQMLRNKGIQLKAAATATPPSDSGEYADSFTVVDDTTDRAVVRVGSTAEHAPIVEATTGNLMKSLGAL